MFKERITNHREFWHALRHGLRIGMYLGILVIALYVLSRIHVSDSTATLLAGLFGALIGAGITVWFGFESSRSQRRTQLLDELRHAVLDAVRNATTVHVPERRIAEVHGRMASVEPARTVTLLGNRPDAIRIRALSQAIGDHTLTQKADEFSAHLESPDVSSHQREAMIEVGTMGERILERIVEIETA